MLVGVAFLIPALQNIGILHHKKTKLCIHMRQSVYSTVGTLAAPLALLRAEIVLKSDP